MGLIAFLKRLFQPRDASPAQQSGEGSATGWGPPGVAGRPATPKKPQTATNERPLSKPLPKLNYNASLIRTPSEDEQVAAKPYEFAQFGRAYGTFLDLSRDSDAGWLAEFDLPPLSTPQQLADWLGVPIGRLFWLTAASRPSASNAQSHYVSTWIAKRSGGHRLIESPKAELKAVQTQILRGILDKVPAHRAAHGFRAGHSIVTNAAAHTGAALLLKQDLENFYPSVGFNRVTAIFRTVGFSREVAIWLARLTTTRTPHDLPRPKGVHPSTGPAGNHLPQGAPTSPAIANLSAFGLDVRLAGLAASYGATYTRYADDLTFSGSSHFKTALRQFIPLTEKIIRDERFRVHPRKRRVIRSHQQMHVTGVVVNERPNVPRAEYDRLKATLKNCVKTGPKKQNREKRPDFASHLRGRIAFVSQCNPQRGAKLLTLFEQINW